MKSLAILTGITLLLFGALPGSSETISPGPLSIEGLTEAAKMVVIGAVAGVHSYWTDDKSIILTRIEVDVEETLKDSAPAGARVNVILLGGKVGAISGSVAGTPSFKQGERVLVFLSERRDGSLGILGLFQGKFSIQRDPKTGGEIAVRTMPDSEAVIDRVPLHQARSQILRALGR
ncbi:MAG: hypothetical protein HY695_36055 [Deltaproteobacteria bacterium]|nr:hypothetical protein [Deltaproteobacteria bacterium]